MSRHRISPILAGVAACALAGVVALPANANLILVGGTPGSSFVDLGAQGFGTAPRLLTMQTNTVETGSVTPVDVTHGDAVAGANKSTTPTLSALGWNSGANVGIGFNADQTGGTGITMDTLVLTVFDATAAHNSLGSFSLASPVDFTAANLALQQGNGNAVFNFGLTPAEQAQFNAILAMSGSSGFFAGLSSELGCPAGAPATCMPSNDGPDSYIGFSQAIVPAPLIGHGFLALLAIGGVLFGSKLLETFKQHRLSAG